MHIIRSYRFEYVPKGLRTIRDKCDCPGALACLGFGVAKEIADKTVLFWSTYIVFTSQFLYKSLGHPRLFQAPHLKRKGVITNSKRKFSQDSL